MRGDMGVFAVVGTSLMFLAFAAMTVAISSQPDLEDAFYNQYLLVPSSLQAASDATSACAGYAVVQSLDSVSSHTLKQVTAAMIRSSFSSCFSSFLGDLTSKLSHFGITASYSRNISIQCVSSSGSPCSSVLIKGSLRYSYLLSSSISGISIKKKISGSVPLSKRVSVVDTGTVSSASNREVYRVLVYDSMLRRYEVNGIWPHS